MVPEASIAELDGGYLINVAVQDGEEITQHAAIRLTLEEAIDYIRDYFKDLDAAEEKLEKYVL